MRSKIRQCCTGTRRRPSSTARARASFAEALGLRNALDLVLWWDVFLTSYTKSPSRCSKRPPDPLKAPCACGPERNRRQGDDGDGCWLPGAAKHDLRHLWEASNRLRGGVNLFRGCTRGTHTFPSVLGMVREVPVVNQGGPAAEVEAARAPRVLVRAATRSGGGTWTREHRRRATGAKLCQCASRVCVLLPAIR